MKLLIVTDAWHPQVNGVVRTLTRMVEGLKSAGWEVEVLGPSGLTLPCPAYPEIRLTLEPTFQLRKVLQRFQPNQIHIATEGPLGLAARRICVNSRLPFTTSFHTRFPEYLKMRYGIPRRCTYAYLRWFHSRADRVLAPSPSICLELNLRRFKKVELWTRGVDTELFHPDKRKRLEYEGPIQLYVGRIAVEKNIEAFLRLKTPGTKVVVGDGPARKELERKFPDAVFLGTQTGERLAEIYASANVFVFPSLTDTFGLVLLEAMASGLPIAAFNVCGPKDVIADQKTGVLAQPGELAEAIQKALTLNPADCRAQALRNSWQSSIDQFRDSLVTFESPDPRLDPLDYGLAVVRQEKWEVPRALDLNVTDVRIKLFIKANSARRNANIFFSENI